MQRNVGSVNWDRMFLNRTGLGAGGVSYRHKFVDMTKVVVEESNFTRAGKTCPAAMGFSFAAGTTDGKPRIPITAVPVCNPECWCFDDR